MQSTTSTWTSRVNPDSLSDGYLSILEKDNASNGSFQDDYLYFCSELNVLACPMINSHILENEQHVCKAANAVIDLCSWRAMLLACSVVNSKVVEVFVSNCTINPAHLIDLAKALEKWGNCSVLRLQNCILDITDENIEAYKQAFASLFSDITCVRYVSLKGLMLGDEMIKVVARSISSNCRIQYLNLANNMLSDAAVTDLFAALKYSFNLERIILSQNSLSGEFLLLWGALLVGREVTAEDDATLKAKGKSISEKNKAIKEMNKKRKKANNIEVVEISPLVDPLVKKDGKTIFLNRTLKFVDLSVTGVQSNSEKLVAFEEILQESSDTIAENSPKCQLVLKTTGCCDTKSLNLVDILS